MKECPSCKAKNRNDAVFCSECGGSLKDVPVQADGWTAAAASVSAGGWDTAIEAQESAPAVGGRPGAEASWWTRAKALWPSSAPAICKISCPAAP